MVSILTKEQRLALKLLAATNLTDQFYFSGGTALAHFYLQHRKSEDLDFFNEQEFDPQHVTVSLKSLKLKLGYKTLDFQSSFNRNIYQLRFSRNSFLKL